jgi:phosphodiesterase/alkaline phosphatase D-like protein
MTEFLRRRWLDRLTKPVRSPRRREEAPKPKRSNLQVEQLEAREVLTSFLGVAAGDASASSAVLWTRIDPQPNVSVTAQVSTDTAFGSGQTFTGMSDSTQDYTVKILATGLLPGTQYYYRFVVGGDTSIPGTFKTTPAADAAAPLHFAFSGDNDGLMRPYALASVIPAQNLDFYVNLGDVIYENASNVAGNNGAPYLNSPSVTLSNDSLSFNGIPRAFIPGSAPFATQAQLQADYSKKYDENFLPVNTGGQNSLQVLYAAQGNYTTWDNHELGNRKYIDGGAPAGGSVGGSAGTDMATGRGVDARNNGAGNVGNVNDAADLLTPAQLAALGGFMNKATGFQTLENTFLSHQPIADRGTISAPSDPRTDGTKQLYSATQWGQNAIYVNTDSRSYRDIRLKTANAAADDTGARADNPDRTYLGDTQLAWLEQTLLDAQLDGTRWKFVSLSDPIDEIGPIGGTLSGVTAATMQPFSGNINYGPVNSDGGKSYIGGYRAERNALLKFIADNHIANVVFLSTDDHQNRINELYYSPTGQTGDQSTYVKVPDVFSIVCGPLGATGPDLFTNHTFAGAKGAADLIANAEVAAGIDPIGLQNYSGLHDLFRDGDPTAGTNPQPVDFYSPDTFNFTVLDVSADGKTLTVKSVGMNATTQNAAIEYANGPQAHTIFSFQVDAFNEVPVAQASSVTTNEDTAKTFAMSDFHFTDAENNPLASITVSGLALASGDTLTVDQGSGQVAVTNGMTITAAQIPTLTFSPAANANGSARSAFNFTVNDIGQGTVAATMTINVSAVNDAPVLTVPATQTTAEDVAVNITGIAVTDVDVNEGTGVVTVTLSVGSGKLTVPTNVSGGLTAVQITGNATGTVVLQGSIAAVNATLAGGVTYLGSLNFHGTDALTVVADDLGNTGAGGALTATKTVSIQVLSPTDQITGLQLLVQTLSTQGALNDGQANSLLRKLERAQQQVDMGKPKVAYIEISAVRVEVLALIASGRLTHAQGDPLLDGIDLLLQSLQIGGGF